MKWDKELYQKLDQVYEQELSQSEQGLYQAQLKELNREYLYETMRMYQRKEKSLLYQELRQGQKASLLFQRIAEKNRHMTLLLMGVFVGIVYAVGFLFRDMEDERDFTIVMEGICKKAHYSNVLKYLYKNPSARHKDIAQDEGISASFLTEIMKELQAKRAVEKFYSGKAAFYELTIDGKAFAKTLDGRIEERIVPDYLSICKIEIPNDILGQSDYEQKMQLFKEAKQIDSSGEKIIFLNDRDSLRWKRQFG
ncbi:MAG: hypothetical protein HFG42_01520 [Lachnospiraceae bacterium]|jgi:predicted transcriptional regulator|nr:hypothetical protein [Lachnospiraceae bacterium]